MTQEESLKQARRMGKQKLTEVFREAFAQPAQEINQPEIFCGVDYADGVLAVSVMRRRPDDVAELLHMEQIELAQPEERYFCQRCGKRTADPTTIHTCTPPQIDPNQWAFDNGLEST